MEAHSSKTQEIFGLGWDPNALLVGDITSTVRGSENGVYVVAEHEGVRLWAQILNGNAIDYRAFAEDGSELGVVQFIEPDARLDQPTENELRPLRPDEIPAGNPPPDDGVPAGNPPPDGGPAGNPPPDGGPAGNPPPPGVPQRRCHKVCVSGYWCVWKC